MARLARGRGCASPDREQAGHVTDDVDQLGVRGDDDLGIRRQRLFHRHQPPKQLSVSHEIAVGGLVHELDGLGLAFGLQDLGLFDPLRPLDLGAAGRRRTERIGRRSIDHGQVSVPSELKAQWASGREAHDTSPLEAY